MHNLTIHYAPGPSVSDFDLEKVYQYIFARLQKCDVTLTCSNETLFLRIRVGVKEGDIPHENVRFVWRDQEFTPDKDGRLDRWPSGFLDTTDELLERMIRT